MSKPVILLGSGDHARVLLSMLRRLGLMPLGIVDPHRKAGGEYLGVNILGGDEAVLSYAVEDVELLNGLGSLPGDAGLRERLFRQFTGYGYRFKTLVDSAAFVADNVLLREGVQVMAGVIIQAGTEIAENTIVNSGAIVDHDCRIGSHVHIAPGSVLSGAVEVGDAVHIGTGAAIIQGIRIGGGSIIGAGSVITQSIDCNQIVYPARSLIKSISRDKV